MPFLSYFVLPLIAFWFSGPVPGQPSELYSSGNLIIEKVSDHVYRHISYLETESFGKVACNGMIVVDQKEALVFDTPANRPATQELIKWVQDNLHASIKAVVPTHFHEDCLAGLDLFHEQQIPSYASRSTVQLARANQVSVPQKGFDKVLQLSVGKKKVVVSYFGEGHTKDNVVAYFPAEKVLFGGCLIKEFGAGKGYLGDATPQEWPSTVYRIKEKYPRVKWVIPGHGKVGGPELLDYTADLFRSE